MSCSFYPSPPPPLPRLRPLKISPLCSDPDPDPICNPNLKPEPKPNLNPVANLNPQPQPQPQEDANLRGGFLLKLSAASATACDAVKLCLVVLQAELLAFCAVHTAAHADVAAGWFSALGSTALSLDGDAAWERASRAVCGVAVFLLTEFRGRFLVYCVLCF